MNQHHFTDPFLDQIKDRVWTVNSNLQLVYANKAYLDSIKKATGLETKLNESVFGESFGNEIIDKWKAYYKRAFTGETFEIQEHFYDQRTTETHYSQIIFNPLIDDDGKTRSVTCQSRNVTGVVQQMAESKQLLDASLDTFCTINEAGDFVFVSAAAEDHWGYLPEELIDKAYEDFILEEDVPKTREIAEAIVGGADIRTFENRYIKKDGSIAYNLWSARWDDEAKLMYCVARNGKEKVEQEALIIQSEQRFKSLVQEGSDLIGILDQEGNYIYVSPTSTSILGMTPEEFIGRSPFEFIHPDDAEAVLESLQKIATEKKVNVAPFRFQNKKKEWRWVESVLTDMTENPAVKGIVANSRDVTDKVEEQRRLKLLESVITNTKDAILITEAEPQDEPGPKIIYVNEAFTKMTGYTAEEIIGKTPRILQGPNSNKEELVKLGHSLRNWEPFEMTTINYKKNGEEFWINFSVTPVANEKGWYTHWIAIERDVTKQKTEELEKDLVSRISDIFNQNIDANLVTCLSELCKLIVKFGDFSFAEMWLPSIDAKTINRVANHFEGRAGNDFYRATENLNSLAFGEGMPGFVWKNKKTEVWGDSDEKWDLFKRGVAATKSGIVAMMGVPLKHKDEVVGILLLGTEKNKADLALHLELFQKLEATIATELNRKKIEIELAQIFNFTPDMICVAGFDGYIKRINPAGLELLGYSLEEMRSRPIKSFIHEEDRLLTAEKQLGLYNGENLRNFENRYLTKEGKIVWLSWTATSVLEHGMVYAVAKNITEEKKLGELNRQAGRLAKIGGWELDLKTMTPYFDEETYRIYDLPFGSPPEVEDGIKFYAPEAQPIIQEAVAQAIENNTPYNLELPFITAKGKNIWVRTYGKVEVVDGKAVRLYGAIQDITNRKDAEIRLQSLADNLPGVVFQYLIKPDGTDILMNVTKGSQQVWGYSSEEVLENNQLVWERIAAGGEIDAVQKSIADAVASKTKWTCRIKYVMPSGELRIHLGIGTPNFLADGSILFNSIMLDITQEVQNEELLRQTAQVARVGSWELDLIHRDGDAMYWSPMTKEILECEESYNPSLTRGFEFYSEESKARMQKAIDELIHTGKEFDVELLVITAKGNERWVRCIGKREFINGECTKVYGGYQDIHESKTLEHRISEILGSISDAFYAVDSDWNFTYFNKQAEVMLQKSREDVIGNNFWEIFPATKWTVIEDFYKAVIANEQKDSIEYLFPRDQSWYEVSAYPSKAGLSVYFKNISERKAAADQLREAFEEKNIILESIGDAFFTVDEDWTITYWNKEAESVMGKARKYVIGKNLWEVYPDALDSEFYRQYLKAMKTGKTVSFQEYYPALEIWIEVSVYPSEKGLSIYFKDITLKKQADIRLLEAKERFEKATEATNDAIWDWDIVSNELYLGGGFKSQFGYDPEKISPKIEQRIEQIHPDDRDRVKKSFYQALDDSTANYWSEEYRYRKSDKTYAYVIDKGIIMRDADSKPLRVVGAMTDLTKQKHSEIELLDLNKSLEKYALELERSNEELEQFAFVSSHDLQEPLRMITSFMDLLKRNYGDQLDSKALQYIHLATDGAKRMKQIILDLLLYSRANKPEQELEEVDLNETLADFKQLRKKVIFDKSVVIHSDQLPILKTHKAPITQVFHGILDNAIKYAKPNISSIIEIKAREKQDEWEFSIKDNGIGIDDEFFEKIFGIFQRLHNREQYEGTGIGLAVAKRSVEFLGGTIWVTSTLGEGSTFYFTIKKQQAISEQYEK